MQLDVTVLITSRPDSEYISHTLRALARSTVQPTAVHLIVHDDGEVDLPVEATQLPLTTTHVDADTTGAALEAVRDKVTTQWTWVLHDDSAPMPDTLEKLASACVGSKAIAAAGPKQVGWDDSKELLEVGINATGSGARVPELDPGEKDQGQFDFRDDVLGVGTAGMLIRTRDLDNVGGFDPALGPFGDGLELSRRFHASGQRVIVVPAARIRHARASYADTAKSFARRRSTQVYNALLAASPVMFPVALLFYILAAPFRALARLVFKDGVRAGGELWAGGSVFRRIGKTLAGRKRLKHARVTNAFTSLEATRRDVSRGKSDIRKAAKESRRLVERPTQERRRDLESLKRRRNTAALLVAVGTLAIGIIGLFPHISALGLTGGAILPDTRSAGELWHAMFSSWVTTGDGYPGYLEPLWALSIPLVGLASLFGGSLTEVAFIFLMLAPFCAGMAAFRASGVFANSPTVRFIAGTLWAASPALLSSISVGSVASVVFHIVLPLVVASWVRYYRNRQSSTLGSSAWWTLVAVAAYPSSFAIVVIVILVTALVTKRLGWLWILFPAGAFAAPALWNLMKTGPAGLVGLPGVPFAYQPSALWETVAGWPISVPGVGGQIGYWALLGLSAALVIGAVFMVLRPRAGVAAGWLLVAIGVGAIALARMSIIGLDPATRTEALAWPGPGMSMVWAGLLIALVAGAHGLRHDLTQRSASLWHVATALVTICLFVLPPLVAVTWVLAVHHDDQIHLVKDAPAEHTPALAQQNASMPGHTRVLVLDPGPEGTAMSIWRGDGAQLTENNTFVHLTEFSDEAARDLGMTVSMLGTQEFAPALSRHAISVIIVKEDDSAARDLAASLDTTDNLSRVTTSEIGTFWRVGIPTSSAMLDDNVLESGRDSFSGPVEAGTLTLAERDDPRWVATLDGEPLEKSVDTWAASWDIPEAGDVHVYHDGIFAQWWMTVARVAVVVTNLFVCLPLRRVR